MGRRNTDSLGLTAREREILGMIGYEGKTAGQIAAELFLSAHTVRTHVKNAMRKLDARRVAQAAVILALDEAGVKEVAKGLLAEATV